MAGHTFASSLLRELHRKHWSQKCAEVRQKTFLKEKGIAPFIKLGLVSLAKLFKSELGFAHNHGTMPSFGGGIFEFVAAIVLKVGKELLCQSK